MAYGLVAAGFTIVKVGFRPGKWALGLIDDYERNEFEAKAALQNAMVTYVLLSSSIEVVALVKSGNSAYRFSFHSKVGRKSDILADFEGDVRPLDKYWRPILSDEPLDD